MGDEGDVPARAVLEESWREWDSGDGLAKGNFHP